MGGKNPKHVKQIKYIWHQKCSFDNMKKKGVNKVKHF